MKAPWRSLLFVPGHDAAKIGKAARSAADMVVIDLEDAVAPASKRQARVALAASADALSEAGKAVAVRINLPWRLAMEDLGAAIRPSVEAIMLPKVEDAGRLRAVGEMIGEFELERGATRPTGIIALIETPAAFAVLPAIAASDRVVALALGSEDYSAALGGAPLADTLTLPAQLLAMAAAARGLGCLAVPHSIAAFRDATGMEHAAAQARSFGATGALCIHPDQVEVANRIFAASDDEVSDAKAVLAAWQEAQAKGEGVATYRGRMIDPPVVAQAERTLRRV